MKKILICSHTMELGGAERALLGLLEAIDKSLYSVDLFLLQHTGALFNHIPEGVNVLPEIPEYKAVTGSIMDAIKERHPIIALGRLIGKYKAEKKATELNLEIKYGVAIEYSHKFTCFAMPAISNKEYDLAISFLTPHYFVAGKTKAKRKIAWIHTDYSNNPVDVKSELKMWAKYDNIVSISDDVTNSFVSVFPELKEKMVLIENIMPMNTMRKQTDEKDVADEMPDDGSIKLLTIGRFALQKRMEDIPEICAVIRENNIDVKWYLIGFGGYEELIKERILRYGMKDYVIILGKKENPYPYIKAADVYIQPSSYEGKSVAVREAQILNKPVIITNFSTANSQLKNGYDGLIVPMNIQECAEAISEFLLDKARQNYFILNTQNNDYTNCKEIQKLYDLV